MTFDPLFNWIITVCDIWWHPNVIVLKLLPQNAPLILTCVPLKNSFWFRGKIWVKLWIFSFKSITFVVWGIVSSRRSRLWYTRINILKWVQKKCCWHCIVNDFEMEYSYIIYNHILECKQLSLLRLKNIPCILQN